MNVEFVVDGDCLFHAEHQVTIIPRKTELIFWQSKKYRVIEIEWHVQEDKSWRPIIMVKPEEEDGE